jgi:hypothetical protein
MHILRQLDRVFFDRGGDAHFQIIAGPEQWVKVEPRSPENDPLEHTNVAAKPELASIKEELQKWLPKHDEPRNPNSAGGKNADD